MRRSAKADARARGPGVEECQDGKSLEDGRTGGRGQGTDADRKTLWDRQKAWSRRVASHPKRTTTKLAVAMVLQNYLNLESGETRVSAETLARDCGIKRRNVQTALKNLVEDGFLRLEKGTGRGNPNRFFRVDGSAEKGIPTHAISSDRKSIPGDALFAEHKEHASAHEKGIPTHARNEKGMRKVGAAPQGGPLPRPISNVERCDPASSSGRPG